MDGLPFFLDRRQFGTQRRRGGRNEGGGHVREENGTQRRQRAAAASTLPISNGAESGRTERRGERRGIKSLVASVHHGWTRSSFRREERGHRLSGFLELSLNDVTILFIVIILDETVSVGQDSLRSHWDASRLGKRASCSQKDPLFPILDRRRRRRILAAAEKKNLRLAVGTGLRREN